MTSGLATERGATGRRIPGRRRAEAQDRHPSMQASPGRVERTYGTLTLAQRHRLSLYIVAVVVADAVLLGVDALFSLGHPLLGHYPALFGLLGGCCVLTQLQLSFRRVAPERDIQITPDGAFVLAMLLCGTPLAAVLASAVVIATGDLVRGYARHKAILNAGQLIISLSLAAVVLRLGGLGLGGTRPLSAPWLLAFTAAAGVAALTNYLLTAAAVAMTAHTPATRVFKEIVRGQLHHEVLLTAMAPIIVAAGWRSLWLVALMPAATWGVSKTASFAYDQGHEATHDQLTQLPNRRFCDAHLAAAVEANQRVAVLVLDLDGFKAINDRYGHHVGDQVLSEVGVRLRGACRATDIVARTGGDEFTLITAPSASPDVARQLAKRCIAAIEGVTVGPLSIGASIGIATSPDHARSSAALVRCADKAMYEAKRTRRGVVVYGEL